MHVLVHIGAKSVLVSVGEGDQPIRWLANVGVARHDEQQGRSLGVPIGVKIDNGTMLNMQDSIAESGLTEVRAPAHTPHATPPPSRRQPYLRAARAGPARVGGAEGQRRRRRRARVSAALAAADCGALTSAMDAWCVLARRKL